MDLRRLIAVTGQALQGASDAAIISNWLSLTDDGALAGIRTQVAASSTDDIDRLDAALLTTAATNFDPSVRVRLVKFYAMFKIVEVLRYDEFRGFPRVG
jgi:hypothetical protein